MLIKLLRDEQGSGVIILAICLTVLLGFTSLVTDVGLLYLANIQLVNAVDAAVLAGAQELPGNPELAVTMAKYYALNNGVPPEKIDIEVFNNNRSIKASAQREVNFLFAKVLGFDRGGVSHSAGAEVGSIVVLDGAVPLGIQEHNFIFGQQYTLKVGAGDTNVLDDISPGWFGALALEGPGARLYEDNLTYGFQGELKIGDIVDIQTGNISGPTKKAIDFRIDRCNHSPACTVEKYDRNCSRLVKVPVIKPVGKKQVEIVGFSMFLVDEVAGQGNESYVTGKFVRTVTQGDIVLGGKDFGLMGVKLVQ